MEAVSQNLISLLQYLLPGFLTAWIFHGLTPHQRPSQFERVVQALIFNLIIQTPVQITRIFYDHLKWSWLEWHQNFYSITFATIVGVAFSFFANYDYAHKLLRRIFVTRETSYPSEWFGSFLDNEYYVVLHLKDERRLYGWPTEWPSDPSRGYFSLGQPVWLEGEEEKPIVGVKTILINAEDVRWVEFMNKPEG